MLGKQGATYTYALQKGATKKELPFLEKGMKNLFQKSKNLLSDLKDLPGFGAAGGTCFGLHTFLNAVKLFPELIFYFSLTVWINF